MKICPYCDSEISDDQRTCPSCGVLYWEADDKYRNSASEDEEEDQGCLSIFALHFLVAAAVFVLVLMVGMVINWLVHFEENQFKLIWTGIALLLSVVLSGWIAKLRQKREKRDHPHK